MADDASDYRDMLAELEATYGPSNIEERRARLMDRLAAEQTATARYSGDELEAPQGYITPAKAVRWVNTDAGPMAVDAEGNSLPLIQQPGVLPLYRDPTIDTVRMASPRVLDIVGDMMGAPLGMTAARVLRAGVKGERPAANVIAAMGAEEIPEAVTKRKLTLADVRREFDPRAGEGMSGDDLDRLVDAYGRVASPASEHPELAAKGRAIAETYITKGGMEYGSGRNYFNTKPSVPLEELGRVADTIPYSHELKPIVEKPWEEVIRERRDSPMITLGGDLSDWVRLRGYGPQDDLRALARATDIHAGFDYMREPNRFTVWANAPEHAEMLEKKILTDPAIQNAIKRDLPVLGTPAPMGPRAIDSAKNFMDTYLSAVEASPIPDEFLKEANKKLKSGLFGSTPKDKDRIRKVFADFPGFENIDAARDFMLNNPEVSGKMRAAVIKGMEKDGFVKQGFPEVGQLRVAATSPKFMMAPGNIMGGRLVDLDPALFAKSREDINKFFDHFTYTGDTPGIYYADTPMIHRHHGAPDVTDRLMVNYNVERPNPKNPDKPKPPMTVHPFSLDQTGRDTWRKMFEEQRMVQSLNDRMLESIQRGEARRGLYGFAEGGSVDGGLDGLVQKYDLPGYAGGGPAIPSYDPMGSFTGMEGLDQEGREPGLYERLADEMAAAGMSVGEPVRQAAEGISDVPSSIARYLAETSEKPDPSQRMAEDIRRFGGAFADQAMSSPTEFAKTVGGFIPGIGEAISAYDAKNLYGDLQRAEAEGDTGKADTLRQLYGLASAGAIPGVGMAARVAGKARAARELSPMGFYSYGAETAAGLPQAKGSPDQMAAMLQKYGVKPDEMYATGFANESATAAARSKIEAEFAPRVAEAQRAMEGLEPGTPEFKAAERQFKNISSTMRSEMDRALVLGDEWSARPSVTRDEIAAHFKERMPQIEETVLGTPKFKDINEMQAAHDAALERGDTAAANRITQDWESQFKGNTKFSQYSLPGGENYREVLLKLNKPQAKVVELEGGGGRWGVQMPDGTISSRYYDRFDAEQALRFDAQKAGVTFTSSHWDDPNVLAHLRMADRTGPNGEKILHVEEIQSDWGQKGKKEGFKDPEADVRRTNLFVQLEKVKKERNQALSEIRKQFEADKAEFNAAYDKLMFSADKELNASKMRTSDIDKYNAASDEALRQTKHLLYPVEQKFYKAAKEVDEKFGKIIDPMETEFNSLAKSGKHPTAPYVTNTQAWTDLALKRALREAAEGGYDKLVWTPGAEQAKRYSLSSHVDALKYIKEPDGTFSVIPVKNNQNLHNLEKSNVSDKELESLFGRDVAEKMKNNDGSKNGDFRVLSGQDLEMGGEGMKGYYDKIVPTQLSKLVKKLDPEARIGRETLETRAMTPEQLMNERTIPDQNQVDFHSLTITPKMREAILGGQTAYAEGGSVQDSGATEAADLDTLFQKYADSGYATGGSVSPQAMANDNLVYDPDEIEAIAAQIRGAN